MRTLKEKDAINCAVHAQGAGERSPLQRVFRPDQTTPRNDAGVSIIVITVALFQIVVVRITILTMGISTRISIVIVIFVKSKKINGKKKYFRQTFCAQHASLPQVNVAVPDVKHSRTLHSQ